MMKRVFGFVAIALIAVTDCTTAISDEPDVFAILDEFLNYDLDQDGIAEISSLTPWQTGSGQPATVRDAKLLLVMVESRLLQNDRELNSADSTLASRLKEYRDLLAMDGWIPVLVAVDVYAGDVHQDGRTVLAIRRMFQRCRESYPNFGGAVFVGSFPEPTLVRRWAWKHSDREVTFGDVTYNSKDGPKATWLALNPELISLRSDVVLCDLDGNWEEIYHQEKTGVEVVSLLPNELKSDRWPSLDETIVTDRFSLQSRTYEDFFFIDDAQYEILENADGKLTFRGTYEMRVPEVCEADRADPNPLARPEIMVSRINPLHVAVSQKDSSLDGSGKPRGVPKTEGSPNQQFTRDPGLELRLLNGYFDRNLAHRKGQMAEMGRRVATMTTDLHTPSKDYFNSTSKKLDGMVDFPKADAVDFVRFLKTPAIVKGVSAHSDASCSVLMKGYSQAELAAETGGGYWNWKASGDEFVPTYNDPAVRDRVHFSLLRTLWENGRLADAGSCFYVHGGCEAICPAGAANNPYNSTGYANHTQIAESLLFYGNGLALIGRAKVFYDIPTGFGESFAPDHGCFGDVLRGYFDSESQNASLGRSVASRNKAYFWSILGDWTLRLEYPSSAKPEGF